MKYLKSYNDLNENIIGDISRLNPDRKINDEKGRKLIDEIISDFDENNKDLRKVMIIDNDKKISFSKISIGKNYALSYVFGKFHSTHRNLHTGNVENFDRRVRISNIPFTITLKRNELEKAFNTSRISLGKCSVKDVTMIPNYEHNSRIEGRKHLHNEKKSEYVISSDISKDLFNYFIDEFNKQYPTLKDSEYKNYNKIREIELGVLPNDNREVTISKIDNHYSSMKNKWSEKIDSYLKKHNLVLEPSEFEPYGFRLTVDEDTLRLEFKINKSQADIKSNLDNLVDNEDFSPYKKKLVKIADSYSPSEYKFVTIIMDTDVI